MMSARQERSPWKKIPDEKVYYKYKKLDVDRKEIRLLSLQGGRPHERIQCRIHHVALSDESKSKHETVSYVWRNASVRATIHINGRRADVPASSAAVLRRVRHESEVRLLWLDAVCINQGNIEEKNHQVATMRHIYTNSRRTLIWLGNSDEGTHRALHSVQRINADQGRTAPETNAFLNEGHWPPNTPKKELRKSIVSELDIEALWQFFSRTWFRRVWVIQEAIVSRRSLCYCGQNVVSLQDIARAARWLICMLAYLPDWRNMWDPLRNAQPLWLLANPASTHYWLPATMQGTLDMFCAKDTTDPRDKIYAVFGIFQHLADAAIPKITPLHFPIDYGKSLIEVLTDATNHCIASEQSLNIISKVDSRLSSPPYPSWVYRWDLKPEFWNMGRLPEGVFDANCGLSQQRSLPGTGAEILVVSGVKCASITELSGTLPANTDSGNDTAYLDAVDHLRDFAGAAGTLELLSDVLVCGVDQHKQRTNIHDAMAGLHAWFDFVERERTRPPSLAQQTPSHDGANHLAVEYSYVMMCYCWQRRLFWTSCGLLGLGPLNMHTGDVIAVLYGCELPLVLRPTSHVDRYCVVGAAYVRGTMDGEAMRNHKASAREDVIFHLA